MNAQHPRTRVAVGFAGAIAALAFFLPWYSDFFGTNISGLDLARADVPALVTVEVPGQYWLAVVGAAAMTLAALWVAGRGLLVVALIGALLGVLTMIPMTLDNLSREFGWYCGLVAFLGGGIASFGALTGASHSTSPSRTPAVVSHRDTGRQVTPAWRPRQRRGVPPERMGSRTITGAVAAGPEVVVSHLFDDRVVQVKSVRSGAIIGRAQACDVVVVDPHVSLEHVMLTYDRDLGWCAQHLRGLDSWRVSVGDDSVPLDLEPTPLGDLGRLRLGRHRLELRQEQS